jgi:hypothetical protein
VSGTALTANSVLICAYDHTPACVLGQEPPAGEEDVDAGRTGLLDNPPPLICSVISAAFLYPDRLWFGPTGSIRPGKRGS